MLNCHFFGGVVAWVAEAVIPDAVGRRCSMRADGDCRARAVRRRFAVARRYVVRVGRFSASKRDPGTTNACHAALASLRLASLKHRTLKYRTLQIARRASLKHRTLKYRPCKLRAALRLSIAP